MTHDLVGRSAQTQSLTGIIVAVGMKHLDAAMKSFLVLTLLFDDGRIETFAERDILIV
jgi:hypothetical protein